MFKIDADTGATVGTIALSGATLPTGLEYFNGSLIANRGNGSTIYDVYDLNGNVTIANFIDASAQTTLSDGIAWDGNNFYVAETLTSNLQIYSSTGSYQSTISSGTPYYDIAALSAVNSATAVPEPFTVIGTIIGGTAALRLRKKLQK